ncbi:MAG: TetR/AcrR family transcriptional regulator [Christensenellales bacterium]|jgi:AcrR family transcriptional regulator
MQKEKANRFFASALLTLMKRKPYEKINISEICNTAFLSRSCFYKYFKSKDELLRYQIRTMLLTEFEKKDDTDIILRLVASLVGLSSYIQIISDQNLISWLLLELVEIINAKSLTRNYGAESVCSIYLSVLFAVRNAPRRFEPDLVAHYWRDAYYSPEIICVPGKKSSSRKYKRSVARLNEAMIDELDKGVPLSSIRVKRLTTLAGVNRSSFYRYFSNTQDMLIQLLHKIITDDLLYGYNKDRTFVLAYYKPYCSLLTAIWQDIGLERFTTIYADLINELTDVTKNHMTNNQIYICQLRNACFAAKRTALLYCFL